MRISALIPLVAGLALACGPADEDEDGFNVDEDCNDLDANINPDAEEVEGDGVDSNCDGDDPPHRYIADWNLASMDGTLQGYDVFGESTESGTVEIAADLSATVSIDVDFDGDVYMLDLTGDVTPSATAGEFTLEATGTWGDGTDSYAAGADWDCVATASALTCEGNTTIEAYAIDTTATFSN